MTQQRAPDSFGVQEIVISKRESIFDAGRERTILSVFGVALANSAKSEGVPLLKITFTVKSLLALEVRALIYSV